MINFKLDRVDRSVNKVSRASEAEVLDLFNVSEIRSKKMKIRAVKESRILKSAQSIFARHEFCRSLMQIVSDNASIAKANIHHSFSPKEKLYSHVLERIFTVWLEIADSFGTSDELRTALHDYVSEKMEISHLYPDGSNVWANKVIHGVPIINDFCTSALDAWTNSRTEAIRCLTRQGKICDLDLSRILYMIWATTQVQADFAHPIETLNDGKALLINRWQQARDTVFDIIWAGFQPKD